MTWENKMIARVVKGQGELLEVLNEVEGKMDPKSITKLRSLSAKILESFADKLDKQTEWKLW